MGGHRSSWLLPRGGRLHLHAKLRRPSGRANSKGVHCTRAAPSMNGCEGIHRTVLRNQE